MAAIKISKTQRDVAIKITICIILIVFVSSISIYLSGTAEEYNKKYTWIKNDISELGRKLDGLNQKTVEFSEAVKAWESLPEDAKLLPGLRINDAKDILDKLQIKYKLTNVKTSFSKPEELSGDYKTDTVMMASSIISMTFNAKSDTYVYGFISDLTQRLPGYMQIKSLSINPPQQITKEVLKQISIGADVNIISVTMDFYWHDLKYKGPSTPENQTGEAPVQ